MPNRIGVAEHAERLWRRNSSLYHLYRNQCSPWQQHHYWDAEVEFDLDYRLRPCTSVITPAPTTTKTMTTASASTETRVSYQLFQSSSMHLASIESTPR